VERAEDQWPNRQYHLDFTRVEPPVEEPRGDAPPPRVDVAVMKGIAARQTYTFASPRIDVGRCQEVRDSRNRLIRTNHVAFTEGADAANQTVSRQHAHITCDPRTGHVRIHDDGSSHGTGIVRDGRTVSVGRGTRGTRLRSGDEIVVGEARLRIRIP
jgi:pSer/pThr/pTyr-binding forkhead associated (FHA) protein